MAIADELIALLGYEIRGEEAAKRYQQTLDRIHGHLTNVAVAATAVAWAAATAFVGAMGFMGRSVINTSAQFETFQAILETIEGSADKARQSLDWVADFAKRTPYDVAQVTEAFVRLKAYGIDPVANDTLRVLGDTASAMGKTLEQAVEMFADASTGEFERLKEFGIKAKQEGDSVTFNWSKNGEELTKTVKKSATEIRTFLLETLGDNFTGAMDRQSRTFKGMTSNIADTWTGFQRMVGEAGFFDSILEKLQYVIDTIQRLEDSGRLEQWAKAISNSLTVTADVIWAFATRIAENAIWIADNLDKIKTPLIGLGAFFLFVIARAFPFLTFLTLAGLVIDDFLAYLQGGDSVIGNFIQQLQDLTGASEGVAQAMAGMAGAVGTALLAAFVLRPFTIIRGAIKGLGLILLKDLPRLAPIILRGMVAAFALVSNPYGWAVIMGAVAGGLIAYFWDDLVAAWNALRDKAIALFTQLRDWILSIDWYGLGVSMITAIWDGMKSLGASIRDWFSSLIPEWAKGIFSGGGPSAQASSAGALVGGMVGNYQGNTALQTGAATALRDDNRQDNRQFPMQNNIEINQTITQPTDAPGAAARATGQAVQNSITHQRTQIEQEPSF